MQLGLRDCADIRVGGDGKHPSISGGERRRVSIGIQMLTDPSILFLDEPTTGLDSFTANYLVEMLHSIANHSKRTVICTVHQPRSDIFHLFDYVMLLSKGRLVYYGKASNHVLDYFSNINYPCPSDMNPADFFRAFLVSSSPSSPSPLPPPLPFSTFPFSSPSSTSSLPLLPFPLPLLPSSSSLSMPLH